MSSFDRRVRRNQIKAFNGYIKSQIKKGWTLEQALERLERQGRILQRLQREEEQNG